MVNNRAIVNNKVNNKATSLLVVMAHSLTPISVITVNLLIYSNTHTVYMKYTRNIIKLIIQVYVLYCLNCAKCSYFLSCHQMADFNAKMHQI